MLHKLAAESAALSADTNLTEGNDRVRPVVKLSVKLPWLKIKNELTKQGRRAAHITDDRPTHNTVDVYSGSEKGLTFWRPLLPNGYSYKASCARLG